MPKTNMTKKQIGRLNAMQLAMRLTRLQFDTEIEPLKNIPLVVLEEIAEIKKELRKILIKVLGRDPYPPKQEVRK